MPGLLRELLLRSTSSGLRVVTFAALAITAPNLFAVRVEFKAYYKSARVEGSEVCFLPKSLEEQDVPGLLATRDVSCLDADKILDVPRGSYYFYVRNKTGLVAPHRSELDYTGRAVSDELYKGFRLQLVRAAWWDVSALNLGPDDRFFAWGSETDRYQAPVFMLEPGKQRLLVPAGSPVIPIISHNGKPVWFGTPVTTAAGTTREIARVEPPSGSRNLLAWIVYIEQYAAGEHATPPKVVLAIDGKSYSPSNDIGPVRFGGYALVEFVSVPSGSGNFRSDDPRWVANSIPFSASSGRTVLLEHPLLLSRRHPRAAE
jgi:hypothetical protein